MKKTMLVLIFAVFLGSCASKPQYPLIFTGNTNHWHIKMVVTKSEYKGQKVKVIYQYKGPVAQLKQFHNIKLSVSDIASTNQSITINNGLTKKKYKVTALRSSGGITRNSSPKASASLGGKQFSHKETTKLEIDQDN
ncbi:MAG TPA: hypothetical protein VFK33_08490 [Bacillales bacterium]|nr:hypothetical protein [Bacillales bacterium]